MQHALLQEVLLRVRGQLALYTSHSIENTQKDGIYGCVQTDAYLGNHLVQAVACSSCLVQS
jgi:hypothetical protein